MEDIIATYPEACGNKACPVQWHLRHVWMHGDGTYSECDTDGNHDDIDENDIPSPELLNTLWADYFRHVAATGSDPLCEFTVKRETVKREAWRFKISPSILGAVITQCQRANRFYWPRELPEHVREYMNLKPGTGAMQDFPSYEDFLCAFPHHKRGTWFYVNINYSAPRNHKTVARELRAVARRNLSLSKSE